MERKAFGIDLGTTYSAIAVYEDGETQILKNAEGTETTPLGHILHRRHLYRRRRSFSRSGGEKLRGDRAQ